MGTVRLIGSRWHTAAMAATVIVSVMRQNSKDPRKSNENYGRKRYPRTIRKSGENYDVKVPKSSTDNGGAVNPDWYCLP